MLLQLTIQNFAIVKSLDIDWQSGMSTITGETGAGKSIAIDALGLCLGDRATTNVVRPNANKADITATFDVKENTSANQWLSQHELENDNECILRRVISSEGRSKAYINGSQVPLVQLKDIGQLLINIHGQHDHQLMTKPTEQRKILDIYANHNELLESVKHYYQLYRKQTTDLEELQQRQTQQEAKQQLLQYQVTELNEFSLQPDEFQTLETDYKRYSNSQQIVTETMKTLHLLSQDEQINALSILQKCHDSLSTLAQYDDQLNGITSIINESIIQLEEANNDLRQYHEKLELDPETFNIIEERYSQAVQLAKKHHIPPEQLPEFHQQLSTELTRIVSDETRLTSLIEEIEQTKTSYLETAHQLSLSRQNAAKKLSKTMSASIKELNMPQGEFNVVLNHTETDKPNLNGQDDVCFVVSINPGQAAEAMHKVASGGELSRISLAMQVILADKVISPTMIFDEVDVGISGPTAAMVGEKLKQLAQTTQIICVTHLPQVACKGHQQLFVAKSTNHEGTETTITELSEQTRIKEIARLLAGNKITESSLANAQELLAS